MYKLGFVLLFVGLVYADRPSPCPDVFKYDTTKKSPGKWEGSLTFNSEFELSGMWVRVILDKKAEKLEHASAETDTDDHVSWLIRMPESKVIPGKATVVPFSVKFNEKDGEPNVVSIRLNAREVCPQKKEAVNISPCPGVFKYTNLDKNEKGKWYGELTFDSEFPLHGIWIRVHLDNKGEVLANGFGEVKPRDNNSYLIRNKDHVLHPGHTLKVPFIVKYEDPAHIPNIKTVRLNARTFCENKLIPTTVRLTAEPQHDAHPKEHPAAALHNVHNHPHHH